MENLLGDKFNNREECIEAVFSACKVEKLKPSIKNSKKGYEINFRCKFADKVQRKKTPEANIKRRKTGNKSCSCNGSVHATFVKELVVIDEVHKKHHQQGVVEPNELSKKVEKMGNVPMINQNGKKAKQNVENVVDYNKNNDWGSLYSLLSRATSVLDVDGDGDCGFRVLALLNNYHEDDYFEIKMDMLAALRALKSPYVDEDGGKTDYYGKRKLFESLSQPKGAVSFENWLDTSGLQLASETYRRVIICISNNGNRIYFPLCFSVAESNTKPMIIKLSFGHYNAVFCDADHPTFHAGKVPTLNDLHRLIATQHPEILKHFDPKWKEIYPECFNI